MGEQYQVQLDFGATHAYTHLSRLKTGQMHPYDVWAREALERERDMLIAAWHAGCNEYD